MDRRRLLAGTFVGGLVGAFAGRAQAATPDKQKVVYHLADLDKVAFVVGNIRNHFDGAPGTTIALVVHGPALKAFQSAQANPDLSKRVDDAHKSGLELHACGNTMKATHITLADLLPGFVNAEQGGVVRLAELQGQGYLYLRP
jgi:intracellular sulfur oxidation DsrE/DsrF family protein